MRRSHSAQSRPECGAIRIVGAEALLSTSHGPFIRFAGQDLDARPGNSPGGAFGTGTLHLARALRAALDGNPSALAPAATFEDGLAQQRVLDAAFRSAAAAPPLWVEAAKPTPRRS